MMYQLILRDETGEEVARIECNSEALKEQAVGFLSDVAFELPGTSKMEVFELRPAGLLSFG